MTSSGTGAAITAGGAVATAVAAALSWLCCLPIVLGALGASLAGLTPLLGRVRPYATLASALLILVALFVEHWPRRLPACPSEDGCPSPSSRLRRRLLLWTAAVAVLVLLTLPRWASWLIYWSL